MDRNSKPSQVSSRILRPSASLPRLMPSTQKASPQKTRKEGVIRQESFSEVHLSQPLKHSPTLSHFGSICEYKELSFQDQAKILIREIYGLEEQEEDLVGGVTQRIANLSREKHEPLHLYCNKINSYSSDPLNEMHLLARMVVLRALEEGHIQKNHKLQKQLLHEKCLSKWRAGIFCGVVTVYTLVLGVVGSMWVYS